MNLESDIQVLYQQHRVFDKTYIFVYYKEKFIVMTKTEYLQLRATINQFYGQVVSRYRFSIIRWGVIFLLLASIVQTEISNYALFEYNGDLLFKFSNHHFLLSGLYLVTLIIHKIVIIGHTYERDKQLAKLHEVYTNGGTVEQLLSEKEFERYFKI